MPVGVWNDSPPLPLTPSGHPAPLRGGAPRAGREGRPPSPRRWPIEARTEGAPLIQLRLQSESQFFDSLDPTPGPGKDLAPRVEEYLVESLSELRSAAPPLLEIHWDASSRVPGDSAYLEAAIRGHFLRRSRVLQRQLRDLLRRGLMSLVIGLGFLVAVVGAAQVVGRMLDNTAWGPLIRESLLILGWVAMWRPLEIFLYDWWPIMGARRLHERLGRATVRMVDGGPG
jgi:hypothetical protein